MQEGALIGGRFRVGSLAGAGGMGTVHRGRDEELGREVALKFLREPSPDDAVRFAREGRLLECLSHPAVVRHVAHGRAESGELWLAMDWLDGEPLAARLARGALELREALAVGERLAQALEAAHAQGIVHRDVKPHNVMLVGGDPARATLVDFGLARLSGTAATRATRAGTILGTAGYMAPEQASGEVEVDARADLFALGCVLYECLSGRAAFAGSTFFAVLAKVLFADPSPVSDGALTPVPHALDTLVQRLLTKDRGERPRDASEVRETLTAIALASSPPSGPAPAVSHRERRSVSVLVVAPARSRAAEVMTLAPAERRSADAALKRALEMHAGAANVLPDGTGVAILDAALGPADVALRAVLAARALVTPERVCLVASEHAEMDGARRASTGDAIERAAQLVGQEAHGGTVVLDLGTAALVERRFEVARSGERAVLGAERPIRLGERLLLGKPTPFVGRKRELAFAWGLVEESIDEPAARALVVTGPAGIGKSRFRHELQRRLEAERPQARVILARSDELGAGSAFGVVRRVVRAAHDLQEGQGPEATTAKLDAALADLSESDRSYHRVFLAELAGTPLASEAHPFLAEGRRDPTTLALHLRTVWDAWLDRELAARPLVLLLDDLHWGDAASAGWFDGALRANDRRALCVIAFARPEIERALPGLWAERRVEHLTLATLAASAGAELARAVLGTRAPSSVLESLVATAGGNAFFLEELLRAEVEGQRADAASARALVSARIESLPEPERRALRAASILGERFWADAVASLLGAPGAEALTTLDSLAGREIVSRSDRSRHADTTELWFRHALVRDAAYAMLTDEDRRAGHRAAAEWLTARGETDPRILAEHLSAGAASEVDWARAAEAWYAVSKAISDTQGGAAALAPLERAEAATLRAGQGELRLKVALQRVFILNEAYDPVAARAVALEVLDDARRLGHADMEAAALLSLVLPDLRIGGGVSAAHARIEAARDALDRLPTSEPARRWRIELRKIEALVALAEDRLADAVDLFTAAAGEASALGHYREAAVSDHNAGESLFLLRRPAEAEERLERSDATAGKHGIAWLVDVNDGTRRFYRAWSDGTGPVLEDAIAALEAEAVAASDQGRGWTAKNQANYAEMLRLRAADPATTLARLRSIEGGDVFHASQRRALIALLEAKARD